MNINYDPKADALDIIFHEGPVEETKEIGNDVFLDVDKNGNPLTLEILDASKRFKVKDFQRLSVSITNYPIQREKQYLSS